MKFYFDIEQRSQEWYDLRAGKITASNFHILTGKSLNTLTCESLLYDCIASKFTPEDSFISTAMQWGIDHEPEAKFVYTKLTGREIIEN